jgi:2,5-dioxopentanoate dehydrogenase
VRPACRFFGSETYETDRRNAHWPERRAGRGHAFLSDPATLERLDPPYPGCTADDIERACALSAQAFDAYREAPLKIRADFLEAIAVQIEALGDTLIERAMRETGLPRARLEGERARTCGQLRLFARTVLAGEWLQVRIDEALPERKPMARPDLRQQQIALGPVVVFGASNFPLAFSVAGGDTASALAAGCPVIVKAHNAHLGTSELVGRAIREAARQQELPEGVFSLLYGSGHDVGISLVIDPRVKAVGFTGSRIGGLALCAAAQARPEPIPVYAEMSSVNPVFLLPGALRRRGAELASGFAASLALGAGQFCTNPGVVIALRGADLGGFKSAVADAVRRIPAQTMLTTGIYRAYEKGGEQWLEALGTEQLAVGLSGKGENLCVTRLFVTSAQAFFANPALEQEIFGASSLIVECESIAEVRAVADGLEGQLTATIHMDDEDLSTARALFPTLERKVGRLLVNGWPTGVEVSDAMVHGGPFPATSDVRSTSVGTAAIQRFLRPICYQNVPIALLPAAVAPSNPLGLRRLMDGVLETSN